MSKMVWDEIEDKTIETGIDMVGLFRMQADGTYGAGVPWVGVTALNEEPSGGEPSKLYADNKVFMTLYSKEEVGLNLECYTYPDEFEGCDGLKEIVPGVHVGQQNRSKFGLVCRSLIASETEGTDAGAKYYVYYGCSASPSSRSRSTTNESTDAQPLSFSVATTEQKLPEDISKKGTSVLRIDSTAVDEAVLQKFLDTVYGTDDKEPALPSMIELIALLKG